VKSRPHCVEVRSAQDYMLAATLIDEYFHTLNVPECFQNFGSELANLPNAYTSPNGCMVLGYVGDDLAGCCALRLLQDVNYSNACEMKRLYVRPQFRGYGLGRDLAETVITFARDAGYEHLLLDTLDEMETARELYKDLGFIEIEPYYHNPIPGAHYLMVAL
jgi:putative acetyltransferase